MSNSKITFRSEFNVDMLSFWPTCAFSDKSTKIGKGPFVCFELNLNLNRCGLGAAMGASPMSKCDEKLKPFRKVVRTLLLSQNDRY